MTSVVMQLYDVIDYVLIYSTCKCGHDAGGERCVIEVLGLA